MSGIRTSKWLRYVKVGLGNENGKGMMEPGWVEVLEFFNAGLSLFFK